MVCFCCGASLKPSMTTGHCGRVEDNCMTFIDGGCSCKCCNQPCRDSSTPPSDATIWRSRGNYGSTVWDSCSSAYLEAYICDDCLKKNSERVYTVTPKALKRENKYFIGICDEPLEE